MTRANELTPLLKRLQLGPMASTLPERIALASREQLDYASNLEIILSDDVNSRSPPRIEMRLQSTGFQVVCRLKDIDLVSVHHHGPAAAGSRSLPRVLGKAQARTTGRLGGSGQELSGPRRGLLRRQGGAHRPPQPGCRRVAEPL